MIRTNKTNTDTKLASNNKSKLNDVHEIQLQRAKKNTNNTWHN